MKKNFLILLFLIFNSLFNNIFTSSNGCKVCDSSSSNCESASKTFFRPRSIIEDVSIYFGLSNYNNYRKYLGTEKDIDREANIHLYRGAFYQQSRNESDLAKYFLPNNKSTIEIKENGTGDVGSLWLGLIAPTDDLFSSTLSLCPTRNVLGSFINYRQDFICVDGLWLDLKFAIYVAEHELRPKEKLESAEGILSNARTALESLDNTRNLTRGRISKCKLKSSNFDDIETKLGYTYLGCEERGYHLDFYGSMLIPIAPRPNAVFLFEPLVGRGHFGLGFGLNGGYRFLERENKSLALMGDFSYQYLFSRKELRSFDLKNGEWSRFLRLADRSTPAISSPAVNSTTLCANVTPRSVINLWAAVHYQHCAWHYELGWNLWWRQSEKICIKEKCPFDSNLSQLSNLGIFDLANTCRPKTASKAKINQSKTLNGTGSNDVVSDPIFKSLSLDNLDLASASHPSVLTNKFYGAVSWDTSFRCRPINIGLAASIEFSRDKNAIEQWGVWANFNANF